MSSLEKTLPYTAVLDLIQKERPLIPVYLFRKTTLVDKVNYFMNNFPGDLLYSVKSNSSLKVLRTLFEQGVSHFDVASLNEIKLIHKHFPSATLYFMHPIKSIEVIKQAYYDYGVRIFSLDSLEELHKIQKATNNATDLSLHVRITTTSKTSAFNLSTKFGINLSEAEELIRSTRQVAREFGLSFHVGSQCMNPCDYVVAIESVKHYLNFLQISVDVLDIGGGFPVPYPSHTPLALSFYFQNINTALVEFKKSFPACKIWAEPGRVLVAEAESLLVKVEARRGECLYLNDGVYGGLFDAGQPNFTYPTKTYRVKNAEGDLSENQTAFSFYGPTCDSLDFMKGPFLLPENIQEGDYIEVCHMGAYSKSIRTEFNGFNDYLEIDLD